MATTTSIVSARTVHLPGKLILRIVPVEPVVGPNLLALVSRGELYVILGEITGTVRGEAATGLGGYVGQSAAYQVRTSRVRQSYRHWVDALGVLRPRAVVLISRRSTRSPMSEDQRLFIEAALVRYLREKYWLVNVRAAAPVAARTLTRREVLGGARIAQYASELIGKRVFHGMTSGVLGGTQREELIRIVRSAGRGLDSTEVLHRARALGLEISGASPAITIRRDLAQRCRQERLPAKVHAAWVGDRRIFFAPSLRQSRAIEGYCTAQRREGRPVPTGRPRARGCRSVCVDSRS